MDMSGKPCLRGNTSKASASRDELNANRGGRRAVLEARASFTPR